MRRRGCTPAEFEAVAMCSMVLCVILDFDLDTTGIATSDYNWQRLWAGAKMNLLVENSWSALSSNWLESGAFAGPPFLGRNAAKMNAST